MTIREAATALEWDPSKLSRVEGLQRGMIVRDVRKLLNLYGVTDEAQREALFEMARQAKQRGWWQAYADVMPSEYANMVGLEAEASEHPDLPAGIGAGPASDGRLRAGGHWRIPARRRSGGARQAGRGAHDTAANPRP